MKKIVALVLTLVLALSLATVAFGATTAEVGEVYGVTDGKVTGKENYVAKFVAGDADDKTVDHYTLNGVSAAIVAADKATDAVYTANGWVYLNVNGTTTYKAVAKNIGKGAEKACDNYYAGGRDMLWFDTDEDGKYDDDEVIAVAKSTETGNGDYYLVDGKLVEAISGKCYVVEHKWAVATYEKDGLTAATIKCKNCGAVAKVATKAEYLAADEDVALLAPCTGVAYAIITTAGTTTTTGVSSAKTFDAGVALYAGMALMSVAGSAVVIGKKKEF